MKQIAKSFWEEPVVALGAAQVVLTGLAAEAVVSGWAPVVSLAVVTYLQRRFVRPVKGRR